METSVVRLRRLNPDPVHKGEGREINFYNIVVLKASNPGSDRLTQQADDVPACYWPAAALME